jgi:hypothetical protein
MARLAEQIALDLLEHDGIATIWSIHLAAARAYREGNSRAAASLIEIADAAEEAWWRCATAGLVSLSP